MLFGAIPACPECGQHTLKCLNVSFFQPRTKKKNKEQEKEKEKEKQEERRNNK